MSRHCTGSRYDIDHRREEKMSCVDCYHFKESMKDLKLCFIDNEINCAYFTEKDVTEQWGDDWNDAPYEYNAEPPYEYDYDAECLGTWDRI